MMMGRSRGATVLMFCTLARSSRPFLVPTVITQTLRPPASTCGLGRTASLVQDQYSGRPAVAHPLSAGQGFGEKPNPPKRQEGDKGKKNPVRKAKSLMPLADAASKLLPKENADGGVQFNNPGVGDFQVLDSLVEYPGKFELKIIGTNEDGFVTDIRRAVAACLTKGDDNVVSCTTREKGRYTSISLKVFVDNSAQLYKCYEVINEDKRVKFKF